MGFEIFPTCPECGSEDECWHEAHEEEKHDGDSWTNTCPVCEREYLVLMSVDVSFDSSPVDAALEETT